MGDRAGAGGLHREVPDWLKLAGLLFLGLGSLNGGYMAMTASSRLCEDWKSDMVKCESPGGLYLAIFFGLGIVCLLFAARVALRMRKGRG